MIDLTPLDVRNKRGDFKRLMRGYDPQEVDVFLELVAERLEGLVRENLQLRERTQTLQQQVTSQLGREQAVQDALVTAQELRADIKAQSQREAEHVLKEAQAEARRLIAEAEAQVRGKLRGVERRIEGASDALLELERRRMRFLKEFRQLLERELDVVVVEEGRTPLEDRAIELDLGPSAVAAVQALPVTLEPTDPGPSTESGTGDAAVGAVVDDAAETPGTGQEGEAAATTEEGPGDETGRGVEAGDSPGDVPPAGASERPAPVSPWEEVDVEDTLEMERPRPTDEARVPTELETPSFVVPRTEEEPSAALADTVEELSASMEAEAMAQAHSEVVEVTGADADALPDVPRLEEVLAEAGADLHEGASEPVSSAPQTSEEIAPPRVGPTDDPLLLYLDPDESER